MPQYAVTDPRTGKVVQIQASRPPTEAEIRYLWSHPKNELPVSLRAPVSISIDPKRLAAAAAPLMAGPGLQELRRAPQAPPPATPISLFSGVTTAPAAVEER